MTAPLPSKKSKVAKPEKNRRTAGLWLRVAGTSDIDYDGIPAPVCKQKTCRNFCCNEGFTAGEIRGFRDQLRKVYTFGGKPAEDAFLKSLLSRVSVSRSKEFFKTMLPMSAESGFVAGGCALCNKLHDQHIDRKHRYNPKCPNWDLGQSILKAKPVAKHCYFMPPRANGKA